MYQSVDEEQAPNPADVVVIEEDRKSCRCTKLERTYHEDTQRHINPGKANLCTHV